MKIYSTWDEVIIAIEFIDYINSFLRNDSFEMILLKTPTATASDEKNIDENSDEMKMREGGRNTPTHFLFSQIP